MKCSRCLYPFYYITLQGSAICTHGDECACNAHAKRFSCARNYVNVNQSKHF